jgi:hypothetical protein
MKIQYLGDSKDSFKWDYHDFLATHLGVEHLVVIPMLTPADSTGEGETDAAAFPARQCVLDFCSALRRSQDLRTIERLPEFSKARYSVALHRPADVFQNDKREPYFGTLDSREPSIVFVDPDNGFEPSKRTEKHIAYADVASLAVRAGESSVITVFHHFRRRSFEDDFVDIQQRLQPLAATALYWHSLMFVAISASRAQINKVRAANIDYSRERPVMVVGSADPIRPKQERVNVGPPANGRVCECGCGSSTKGEFAPGHDQKLRAALERASGGLLALRKLVEREHGVHAVENELFRLRK